MVKIVFITVFLLTSLAFASTKAIESKINSNKKILEQNKRLNQQTQAKIDNLSKEIKTQTTELNKINSKIKILNQVISTQKDKLQLTQKRLEELEAKALSIQKAKEQSEYDIVNIIIENFSWAFALNLASKKSLQEIIDSEMYAVLSSNTKDEINRLNKQYLIISQNKIQNEEEIVKLKKFIQVETKRKESLASLQKKQEKPLVHYTKTSCISR